MGLVQALLAASDAGRIAYHDRSCSSSNRATLWKRRSPPSSESGGRRLRVKAAAACRRRPSKSPRSRPFRAYSPIVHRRLRAHDRSGLIITASVSRSISRYVFPVDGFEWYYAGAIAGIAALAVIAFQAARNLRRAGLARAGRQLARLTVGVVAGFSDHDGAGVLRQA